MDQIDSINDNYKLSEAVADIAYYIGQKGYYSGNSREDIANFITWATEFEHFHRDTDRDQADYTTSLTG